MEWLVPSFAFILSIAYWPGIQGAGTSPRWAIAALSLYFLDIRSLPLIGLLFFRIDPDSAFHWAIIFAALCWGMAFDSLSSKRFDNVIKAFCIGIAINGAVASGQQFFDWGFIPQAISPSGLFVNKNLLGETACLAFVAAMQIKAWPFAVMTLPAILLSQSRTVWLATFLGFFLLLRFRQQLLLSSVCLFIGLVFFFNGYDVGTDTLLQRFSLWQHAIKELSFLGNGSYDFSTVVNREPNLHNDWLQMVYEWGIFALLPLVIIFFSGMSENFAFIAALIVLGSFAFPLHMPATGWFAAFVIGYYLRKQLDESGVFVPRWYVKRQLF